MPRNHERRLAALRAPERAGYVPVALLVYSSVVTGSVASGDTAIISLLANERSETSREKWAKRLPWIFGGMGLLVGGHIAIQRHQDEYCCSWSLVGETLAGGILGAGIGWAIGKAID